VTHSKPLNKNLEFYEVLCYHGAWGRVFVFVDRPWQWKNDEINFLLRVLEVMKQVGIITADVIHILGLDIAPDTPIYLGETNINHMLSEHETDYKLYGEMIEDIIASPTYVGYWKGSIEYIKELSQYVKVAVRVSSDKLYFARTLYTMNPDRVEKLVANGSISPLT